MPSAATGKYPQWLSRSLYMLLVVSLLSTIKTRGIPFGMGLVSGSNSSNEFIAYSFPSRFGIRFWLARPCAVFGDVVNGQLD